MKLKRILNAFSITIALYILAALAFAQGTPLFGKLFFSVPGFVGTFFVVYLEIVFFSL